MDVRLVLLRCNPYRRFGLQSAARFSRVAGGQSDGAVLVGGVDDAAIWAPRRTVDHTPHAPRPTSPHRAATAGHSAQRLRNPRFPDSVEDKIPQLFGWVALGDDRCATDRRGKGVEHDRLEHGAGDRAVAQPGPYGPSRPGLVEELAEQGDQRGVGLRRLGRMRGQELLGKVGHHLRRRRLDALTAPGGPA